ncbi:Zinc finger protein [Plecturocebus cupreus]
MHHHTGLIFVFFGETGFCHVDQAGLELLASSDPPALASQSASIICVSHHTDGVLPCCPGWSQTPGLKPSTCLGLPMYWDYRHEPQYPALNGKFKNSNK